MPMLWTLTPTPASALPSSRDSVQEAGWARVARASTKLGLTSVILSNKDERAGGSW